MFKSGDKVRCIKSSIISYWDENGGTLFDRIQNETQYFDARTKTMVTKKADEKEIVNIYEGSDGKTYLSFRKSNFIHPAEKFIKI